VEKPPPLILIVDEDPGMRAALAQGLSRAGYAVETAAGAGEALASIGRSAADLLLADPYPPAGGGVEFLRRVKAAAPRLPVIVLTAGGTVAGAVDAMQAGACDYLLKPLPPEPLLAAIRRALNGGASAAAPPRRAAPSPAADFITRDPETAAMLETARRVAATAATVLIQGESGTGKELLARFIHRHSPRAEGPYVAVNCAALPETLAESELFGHEKGAFTGALGRKTGKFELAHRGTLILDEIGEMPLSLQAKLLRALQEKAIDRIGGREPVPVDVRIVAVTNRDLAAAAAAGSFREDLFYRINVMPLRIPPLRERPGDIARLAEHFRQAANAELGKAVRGFTPEALEALNRHGWRGNVRELENTVARAVILAEGEWVEPRHLRLGGAVDAPAARVSIGAGTTVWEMERRLILGTLAEVDQNRTRAAEMLGISIRTLRNKLREYREKNGAAAS
jgi:two-component system response regulator FlrC